MLSRFFKDRRGGVAPLLALIIPWSARSAPASIQPRQHGADRHAKRRHSTALMLSRDAQTSMAPSWQKATAYFARCSSPEASNAQVTRSSARPSSGFTLKVTGSATISTIFWRLMGRRDRHQRQRVLWGIKLNLALALDNTGSMASSGK